MNEVTDRIHHPEQSAIQGDKENTNVVTHGEYIIVGINEGELSEVKDLNTLLKLAEDTGGILIQSKEIYFHGIEGDQKIIFLTPEGQKIKSVSNDFNFQVMSGVIEFIPQQRAEQYGFIFKGRFLKTPEGKVITSRDIKDNPRFDFQTGCGYVEFGCEDYGIYKNGILLDTGDDIIKKKPEDFDFENGNGLIGLKNRGVQIIFGFAFLELPKSSKIKQFFRDDFDFGTATGPIRLSEQGKPDTIVIYENGKKIEIHGNNTITDYTIIRSGDTISWKITFSEGGLGIIIDGEHISTPTKKIASSDISRTSINKIDDAFDFVKGNGSVNLRSAEGKISFGIIRNKRFLKIPEGKEVVEISEDYNYATGVGWVQFDDNTFGIIENGKFLQLDDYGYFLPSKPTYHQKQDVWYMTDNGTTIILKTLPLDNQKKIDGTTGAVTMQAMAAVDNTKR